ncbi:Outer envelope pore protein 16, chloroplastic [Glycine max]|nr:Outer envelope pore protein 16, chloroplastic [Glycine max]
MPWVRLSESPRLDVAIDMGNPFLNLTVDGFLKIGAVAATRSAAEDTYHIIQKGNISSRDFEKTVSSRYNVVIRGIDVFSIVMRGLVLAENDDDWGDPPKDTSESYSMDISWCMLFFVPCSRGTIAGVYVGMEYGVERIRGTRDWKNAMIGGAVTGALVSAASNNKKDKIAIDAITGAAIATAAEFINYLT